MSTRFLARIDGGRIIPAHPERVARYAGKDVWVSIHDQPSVGLRSSDANRYLWGVCYRAIAEDTGNDPESIHYGLKREACRVGVLEPEYIALGDNLIEADPTTKTDSDTFQKYVTWVQDYAFHKLGILIPPPTETA